MAHLKDPEKFPHNISEEKLTLFIKLLDGLTTSQFSHLCSLARQFYSIHEMYVELNDPDLQQLRESVERDSNLIQSQSE